MKPDIIENVSIFLLKKGFTIKNLIRTCFDIVARKEGTILLIKTLEDANSVSKEYAEQMENIASYINGVPLIIAHSKLENNVIYTRFGVYTLNLPTFKNAVEQQLPFIKSGKAGLTASIEGSKLKKKREELGISLNSLSKKLGVSARMMSKYEDGIIEVTLNKAYKIYDVFGKDVFNKINIFQPAKDIFQKPESNITKKYQTLGFNATDTKKSPFDVIAKKEREIILTKIGDKKKSDLNSFSKLIDADNLVIFKKKKPKNIAAMTLTEFMEFEKASELIKFLKEFED